MIRFRQVIINRAKHSISVGSCYHEFDPVNRGNSYKKKGTSIGFEVIAHLLLNGHTSRQELFDMIYEHDESGGPISGYNIFDVRFSQWKPIFDALGLRLCREKQAGKQLLFFQVLQKEPHSVVLKRRPVRTGVPA